MRLPRSASWLGVCTYLLSIAGGAAAGAIMLGPYQTKDWAAWVQSIGSVLAILVAVAVPAVQHQRDADVRRRTGTERAKSLSLYLLPSIRAFAEANNAIWENEHPDHDVRNLEFNNCYAGPKTMEALQVPKALTDRIEQLHDLGPAAAGVTNAIYMTNLAKELITHDETGSPIIFNKKEFYDLMWDALGGLTQSMNRIRTQFPNKPRPMD